MKWFCLALAFLITVLPYGHCYGYRGSYSSTEEENSRKLSTLEKQVKVLTNELKALKEDVHVLKGEPIPGSEPDLLPLEASRIMLPGGRVRFTLKYRAKVAILGRVRVYWIDTDNFEPIQESVSNEIPRLPVDVYQTSVETSASNTTHVSVIVGTFGFWYGVNIKNALEGNAVQQIISLPVGHVTPPDDIVYEPGTNASIQLTGPLQDRGNPGSVSASNMDIQFQINPPGTDDILQKYGYDNVLDNFFAFEDENVYFDKREINIVFHTSVIAYSGLVMVMFGQSYGDDLVYRIEKSYMLTLHPSNQSAAFREGLLAAQRQSWMETNDNGDQVERCQRDELCRVFCQVFGNNPNQVVMLRTVNGVVETLTPTVQETSAYFSYAMDGFYMTSDPNPINYTCVGSNAGGQRVVNTYMVYLQDPPTFVDNQTAIEVSPEGEVNVTCTATGSPLPQMDIRFSLPWSLESTYSEGNLEVLYQTNNTISVTKVMTPRGLITRRLVNELVDSLFVFCQASNTGGENTRQLTLE